MFKKHDWNYYYNKIESAERAYHSYKIDDKHNLKLIKEWEKSVTEAGYYHNKTVTQEGISNVSTARQQFLETQKHLVKEAKSRDHGEYYGMGLGYGLK
ncbi:hypothetical protein [Legionella bozemanae]|uniref:Uncharacterized protein n=1 Tax=Legionella bozemanae TaxID=447 RepID=A0A0W0R9T9_LEGBO|nr:hypothetical protein [Legionella bozemanae]KTC67831.1 hypothetical protein Lboz_3474 [Legionella bozemanae]STP14016.1 Uncharacterised protein [Legionella bozemanae]